MEVKLNTLPASHHGIRAEIKMSPVEDTHSIFKLPLFGWNHILLNEEHYILNCQTWQLIPCKDYSMAQDWCFKFSCQHLMI
jgi:hypothetical protein